MDKIIICYDCDGTGQVCYDVGSHKSKYEYEKCKTCSGSGRLEQTTDVTHEPFVPGGVKSKRIF